MTWPKRYLFRAARSGPQTKADITDSTARAIMKEEADSREAKTRRLRQARLEMEAQRAEPAPVKCCAAKKAKYSASRRAA